VHWVEQPAAESIAAGWHNGDIDVATFEPTRQSGSTVLDQMNIDADVALAIARQELRKETLDRLRSGSDAQHSDFSAFEGAGPFAERRYVGQQAAAALQQVLTL
jgi:hypothetical protein